MIKKREGYIAPFLKDLNLSLEEEVKLQEHLWSWIESMARLSIKIDGETWGGGDDV